MKKTNFSKTKYVSILTLVLLIFGIQNSYSQTYCTQPGTSRYAGEKYGFRYELWNLDGAGTACMTVNTGALFSGEWIDIQNYLARRGLSYNETQEHQEIGTFYATYDCDYNPAETGGNSYLSIYGWTVDPLKEFYIVEDWRSWIPSMDEGAEHKGTIEVNGSIYDIIENTRYDKPSIIGNTTFKQYFSIRRDVRNSGTIDISKHFKKWESLGMEMGKMYEVSFVVEGYENSGSFDFSELNMYVEEGTVSDIASNTEEPLIKVFPNPGSGKISIELPESENNVNVKIHDVSGSLISSREQINNNQLEVSDLKTGIYFINAYNQKVNYITKFIIN